MPTIDGYTFHQLLHQDTDISLYLGNRDRDGAPVVLKTPTAGSSNRNLAAHLHNEYRLTHGLEVDGVRPVWEERDLDECGRLALILPYVDGPTLKDYTGDLNPALKARLRIARRICSVLAGIHRLGLVHKDINPDNVLVVSGGGHRSTEIVIIDFGIASKVNEAIPDSGDPKQLDGTLPYLSPEQTGRVNRTVDHRSDLYSMGVLLFELFTGRLPFICDSPLELVHAHIAQKAPELDALWAPRIEGANQRVVSALAHIVARLLAKSPEDRYQSATGVGHDLGQILDMIDDPGLEPCLEERDLRDVLVIPERLYGRNAARERLQRAFEALSPEDDDSRPGLFLLSGPSGIGKTALVREAIGDTRGLVGSGSRRFIQGKFDQYGQDMPYRALSEAIGELCRQLLTEPDRVLETWRGRILDALGANARLIIDLAPDLGLMLGDQPPAPELEPPEARQRFNLCLQALVHAIASADHPLVLFLDDLQWADPASLEALERMLSDADLRHVLITGAYRDEQVSDGHPLLTTLNTLRGQDVPLVECALAPLSPAQTAGLLGDTLGLKPSAVESLARLVTDKTGGNPFFVRHFVRCLHDEGLLWFEPEGPEPGWRWDSERISRSGMTDNLVDLPWPFRYTRR